MKCSPFFTYLLVSMTLVVLVAQMHQAGVSVICLTPAGTVRIEFSGDGQNCMAEPCSPHEEHQGAITVIHDCGEDCKDIPMLSFAEPKSKESLHLFSSQPTVVAAIYQTSASDARLKQILVRSRDPASIPDVLSTSSILLL